MIDIVHVFVDGKLEKIDKSKPYMINLEVDGSKGTEHLIEVTAFDFSGNSSTAIITVKIK